jgi:transglutaminase-like putative cysteine protease
MTIGRENPPTAPRPGGWPAWVSVMLLFLVAEIAVLSIEQANWITPQPALTLVLVIAVAAGLLLTRGRFPGPAAHIIALAAGIGITAWQAYQIPYPEVRPFAAFIVLLTWLMGYFSTWLLRRRQNAWLAVCLGALIIVVNLSNLPEDYYYFFGIYFVAAVCLITWSQLVKQGCISGRGAGSSRRSLLHLGASLLGIFAVAVLLAYGAPAVRTPQFQTMLASRILWKQNIEDSSLNIFAAVPAKQAQNTSATRRNVSFGDTWFKEDRVDFVVNSPQPLYWRVEVYDTYTSRGWENRATTDLTLGDGEPWEGDTAPTDGEQINYTVTTGINTDVLLTAGDFVAADMPVVVRVSDGEPVSVTTPRTLGSGESYTVTSRIAVSSLEALAAVGGDWPEVISNQYRRLPLGFPDEIGQLAEEITRDATTPYAKVTAIDNYLSRFPYDEDIEPPPPNADGVAYFLFTQRSGYCLYYASAMVVMLRSVDVPARLAIGYLPGERGADNEEYTLHNSYYHAWAQAYFAGFGWIDLEATPSGTGSRVPIEAPWVSARTAAEPSPPGVLPSPSLDAMYGWPYGLDPGGGTALPAGSGAASPPPTDTGWPWPGVVIPLSVIAVLAVTLLVLRSVFRHWLWQVDSQNPAAGVYARLSSLAAMLGLGPKPQQTPLEYAAVLATEFPEQARNLDDIARAYVENRFGRKDRPPEPHQAVRVLKARRGVYESLLKRLGTVRSWLGPRRGRKA